MIKQLLNSVITKYHDLPVPRRSVICLSLRLRQIIYLLATDKSRYFVQPRPIIVNYYDFFAVSMINLLVRLIVGLDSLDGNFGRQKLTKLVVSIKVVELSSPHHLVYIICT